MKSKIIYSGVLVLFVISHLSALSMLYISIFIVLGMAMESNYYNIPFLFFILYVLGYGAILRKTAATWKHKGAMEAYLFSINGIWLFLFIIIAGCLSFPKLFEL